ncbi:MAG TPA: terminase, partial [Ramlibacter sp.]|nr:terminase [Ramlibacter sp.]
MNFIAWALGKVPDSEFIHLSYSGTLAVGNTAQAKALVESDTYREVFPEAVVSSHTKAKGDWHTTAGGVVYAQGAGGTITGFGAGKMRPGFGGAIIIDDPHKADEARSKVMREGVIEWFRTTVESRRNDPKNTPIIVIMQRLHEADLSGWLLGDEPGVKPGGNGEVWEHLNIPAISDDGQALWPAKHTIEQLRVMERASPYVFAGQYGQRPAPLDGGLFKPDQLVTVDAIPAGVVRWVRGWDFAGSTDGDYTAGGKLGQLADGRFIIAGMARLREGPDARDKALRNTAASDG